MALNRPWSRDLFTQAWVDNLSPSVERSMPDEVQFYDPETAEAIYDPVTNSYISVPEILLTCKARVQPIRSAAQKDRAADSTTVQTVLVSIPIALGKNLDLRPHHRAKVLSAPLMPVQTKFIYVVREVMDSSNPIERTFYFDVNQEAVEE